MKKILRKSLSVFLSALMFLTIVPAFVFAADEVAIPNIALEKVSETQTQVVIRLALKENSFNCLDLQVDAADGLTLTEIVPDSSVASACSSNVANGMISIASINGCVAPLTIAEYTYTKDASDGVVADDFSITIYACYVGSTGNETDITESAVVSIDVPAEHSHIGGDWVETTAPACNAEGEETSYCTECGEVAETRPVDKTDHTNTTTLHLDPSCTEDGYDKVFCLDCETYVSETTLPKTDHKVATTDSKEPTCTEDGYEKEICSCGHVISETVLPATGHTEASRDKKAASCTEDGYIKVICECGEVMEEITLPSPGHSYITDIRNASCDNDGYVQTICRMCRDIEAKTTLPATGHSWLDWETVKEPTVSAEGIERKICDNCGIDEERSIPRLVVAPTELVMSMQEVSMNYKATMRLFVNVLPEDAAYSTEIIWESSNPEVATVNEDGEVYAVNLGTTTITATSADGTVSATCEVTVKYSIIQWIIVYILFGWIWYV